MGSIHLHLFLHPRSNCHLKVSKAKNFVRVSKFCLREANEVLPVMIYVGTNNEKLLKDPMYVKAEMRKLQEEAIAKENAEMRKLQEEAKAKEKAEAKKLQEEVKAKEKAEEKIQERKSVGFTI